MKNMFSNFVDPRLVLCVLCTGTSRFKVVRNDNKALAAISKDCPCDYLSIIALKDLEQAKLDEHSEEHKSPDPRDCN